MCDGHKNLSTKYPLADALRAHGFVQIHRSKLILYSVPTPKSSLKSMPRTSTSSSSHPTTTSSSPHITTSLLQNPPPSSSPPPPPPPPPTTPNARNTEGPRSIPTLYFEYDGDYIYPDLEGFPQVVKDCVLLMVDNMVGPYDEMMIVIRGRSLPEARFPRGNDTCDCEYEICVAWPPSSRDSDSSSDEGAHREESRHS